MATEPIDQEIENTFTVSYETDVHLIQILGEQLIGSEKIGILELIKNAYDANARVCNVWIEKIPGLPEAPLSDPEIENLPGPVISIIDDGDGMDQGAIKDGWLRAASRYKTSAKERLKQERLKAEQKGTRAEYEMLVDTLKKERGGRIPLGEKGAGRFAANRLGRFFILKTKSTKEQYEWVLLHDWNDFIAPDEKPLNLDKVTFNLIRQAPTREYKPRNSGTVIRIYGGREGFEWTPEKLREVGQTLAMLRSPRKENRPANFDVIFNCPQLAGEKFETLTETVPEPFLITAFVDECGIADIEIEFKPPDTLRKPLPAEKVSYKRQDLRIPPADDLDYWHADNDKKSSELRTTACGEVIVQIKCWLRTKEWIEYADWKAFTLFLENYGGVGIFRDGLGILPAQKGTEVDWLRLSKRHIKKGEHVSYYQLWGSVDLLQEKNLELVDRTSREGLLETVAFNDLSNIVRMVVFTLERYVDTTRKRYNRLIQGGRISVAALNKKAEAATLVLDKLAKEYDFNIDPLKIKDVIKSDEEPAKVLTSLSSTMDLLRKEVNNLQEQSDALLEAAGFGIAISVAVHEIEKITSNLYYGLERTMKNATTLSHDEHMQLDRLSLSAQNLLNELKRIAPLRVTRLEPKRKFKIRDAILAGSGAFQLAWEEANIKFIKPSTGSDFVVEGSFGACSQIFANLFDNATYWINITSNQERRIIVQIDSEKRKVVIADSGPGIDPTIEKNLFEPFYSLKNPPSGIGLYICRYYAGQMKGLIRKSTDQERIPGFPGAQVTLIFREEINNEQ